MLSGLFITFGKNPYATNLFGFITNLWIMGTVLIAKEYIRFKLVNNVYVKDKVYIAVCISIIYIIIEMKIGKFFETNITMIYIVQQIAKNLLPLITKNVLYSYMAIYADCMPAIFYELMTKLYLWLSPILPKAPWIMVTFIDAVIPFVLFLYIRYVKNKKDFFRTRQNIINTNPKHIVPLIIVIILAIWFAIGIFPIKPISIASGSMEPELYVGDVAFIKKCNANDVIEGDIIEYQMEGYTVIHRVMEKRQEKGEYYFITKGDNNKEPDKEKVSEDQLIGKVIFKVRYLGYPAIWLHVLQTEETIEVETQD